MELAFIRVQLCACQVQMPSTVPAEGHLLGQAIRLPGTSEADWQPTPSESDVVYTSHVLSSEAQVQAAQEEKEEGNQQECACRNCSAWPRDLRRLGAARKLVKQLASVLKGLEADVESLRRENHSLRKTVLAAVPQRFPQELRRPEEEEEEEEIWHPDMEESSANAGSAAVSSVLPPANPLQTRSTPPPSARLATPPTSQPAVPPRE
eukprot:Skav214650  [mRNA]  locus=scaffold1763:10785:19681:- [translate_table: standard]